MLSRLFQTNPFDRQALKDEELLSGKKHKQTLKNIRNVFGFASQSGKIKSIILRGDRGTGKTSLLKISSQEAKNYNIIPVSIYLTENNSRETIPFFHGLYNNLFSICKENGVLIDEINEADLAVTNSELSTNSELWVFEFINKLLEYKTDREKATDLLAEDLVHDFKLIIDQFRRIEGFNENTKVVFFIDEAQFISNNTEALNIIRHIIQEEIGVGFFLASQVEMNEDNLHKVFDSLERAFKVLSVDYFETHEDVRDYFKKSLKSVGWKDKDFKLYINKFDSLVKNILDLTGGKPEFVTRIADEMFNKVMIKEDNKLRLNQNLLLEIARDIERQSTTPIDKINGFNLDRAQFILDLNDDEFFWFSQLTKSLFRTTPRSLFHELNVLHTGSISTFEEFEKFYTYLVQKNYLVQLLPEEKTEERRSYGLKAKDGALNPMDSPFAYLGSYSERSWISIMLSTKQREIKFISQQPYKSIIDFIVQKALYRGKYGLTTEYKDSFIFSAEGYQQNDFELQNIPGFFSAISSKEIDITGWDTGLISFLFDVLTDNLSYVEFFSFNLNLKSRHFNFISYKSSDHNDTIRKQVKDGLDMLKTNISNYHTSFEFEYRFDVMESEQFPSYGDLEDIILSSDNSVAKTTLYRHVGSRAIELYLDDREGNKDDIEKWLNCIYASLVSDEESVDVMDLNNAGYMFMNVGVRDSAQDCFNSLISRYESGHFGSIPDNKTAFFLVYYNSAILASLANNLQIALERFHKAMEFAELIEVFDLGSLNALSVDEQNQIISSEYRGDHISVYDFVSTNIELIEKRM